MLRSILTTALMATAFAAGGASYASAESKSLVVAGGCFWCVESDFDHVVGVTDTVSGYGGGTLENPTYRNHGNHREVVKITYDPAVTDYETLVTTFIRTIDPTDGGGQFCDRGRSYAPAIHASTDEEMAIAEKIVADAAAALDRELAIPVEGTATFYEAEDYHQNYWQGTGKKLTRFGVISQGDAYKKYRNACGRDQRVKRIWGDQAYAGVTPHGS